MATSIHADSAGQSAPVDSRTPDASLSNAELPVEDLTEDTIPPPAYGDTLGEVQDEKQGASASITDEGRVNIRINNINHRLSAIFNPALRQNLEDVEAEGPAPPSYVPPSLGGDGPRPPPCNVVIQVVGSRGDVQPFVALGKVLKNTYRHRVRLATHPQFKDFVEEHNLEFFSIGGDPSQLMSYMVQNPGLRPGFRTMVNGDISARRRDVAEYIQGCWRSCYQAGNGLNDGTQEEMDAKSTPQHFVADCIIANPPSLAHIHCAEKLGIPLHIVFTMPYSPTQAFPHPLANIQSSDTDPRLSNYISYSMIELLSWQGLGDIINRFRAKCLALDPISTIWAPGMLQRMKIPHTYCWSPALIPKPKDWASHITIAGFSFLDLATDYTPATELDTFLKAGPPPVYIGFGSIVLDDPNAMTELIFETVRSTGQRVLLSKGWGGIGGDELSPPPGVFMLGSVPHDWLFKHVSCVVHHGGAGTTAAGITAGRPTVVVPFFGDQPFWGAMIARAGAGPVPIPHKQLTAEKLADAINFCLKPETLAAAQDLASKMAEEKGSEVCAQSVHQFLKLDELRCTLAPDRVATWRVKRTKIKLSAFAACTLANAKTLDFRDLKLIRAREHYTDEGPVDPISGAFTAFVRSVGDMAGGLTEVPGETWKAVQYPIDRSREKSKASPSRLASKSKASISDRQSNLSGVPGETDSTEDKAPPPRTDLSVSDRTRATGNSKANSSRKQDALAPSGVHMTKGAGRFARAVAQGPVNIANNLTRGAHSLPKLWGDETVRPQERVTGLTSGFKAVSREFGFGFYDGITGLVTQPYKGARKEGATGFVKGVGKGTGGFFTKMLAGSLGILSHTLQGFSKEAEKLFGNNVQSYIIASRAAQGYEEWQKSTPEERESVINRWKVVQKTPKKRAGDDGNIFQPGSTGSDQGMSSRDDSHAPEATSSSVHASSPGAETAASTVAPNETTQPGLMQRLVENDISRLHLQQNILTSHSGVAEARPISTSSNDLYGNSDYDSDLSLTETNGYPEQDTKRAAELPVDDPVIAGSSSAQAQGLPPYDRGHIEGTTQEQFEAQQAEQPREKTAQEKTEEQIVLEYVKKQSIREAEHRGKSGNQVGSSREREDLDDEELQKALKLSMQDRGR